MTLPAFLQDDVALSEFLFHMMARDPLPQIVTLAIVLLHEIINKTLLFLDFGMRPQLRRPKLREALLQRLDQIKYCHHEDDPCTQYLLSIGWCPAQVEELKLKLSLSGMLYVANLPRPDQQDHEQFSGMRCRFAKVEENGYQTHHIAGCKGCEHVSPKKRQLSSILEGGAYPVIRTNLSDTGSKLLLQPVDTSNPYVAISHVWSDGLSNVNQNSIPRCQFDCLSRLVRRTASACRQPQISAFWLDTVSCPVADGAEIQNIAIHKMKSTYENAAAVLVLDSNLLQQSMKGLTNLEKLTGLVCYKWTSRLWTYQEGVLAKRLLIQFADGVYDLDDGFHELLSIDDDEMLLTHQHSVIQHIRKLYRPTTGTADIRDQLISIAGGLVNRATSCKSDEPICLVNLLGLDVVPILEFPPTEPDSRMAGLWKQISPIPHNLVFGGVAKLCVPGFRWAPRSLLRPESGHQAATSIISPFMMFQGETELSNEGFRFTCRGYDLHVPFTS
jgi:hypothetical protein